MNREGPDDEEPDHHEPDHHEPDDEEPDDEDQAPGRPLLLRRTFPVVALLLAAWSATVLRTSTGVGLLDTALVVLSVTAPGVALAAVPLATAALWERRWFSGAVALVAGLLPWVFVAGYATAREQPAGASAPLRTMVVNAGGGAADPAALVQTVRDQAVDLLVVTELSPLLSHELTAYGLDAVLRPQWVEVAPEGDVRAGTGVWSRHELREPQRVAGTGWPAVRAEVTTGQGSFTLVAGQARPAVGGDVAAWRADLVALAAAARAGGPVVVLGDLNAAPWQPEFRRFAADGLEDAADATGRGLRPTWPAWSPVALLPLDHTVVGGGVGAVTVESVPLPGTDQRALVSELTVPTSGG